MKQGINLSLGRKRVDYALRKFQYAAIAAFCICVVISLVLIAYRLILKGSFEDLTRREEVINAKLLGIQEKRDKFLETKSRLIDVRSMLTKRSPMTARLETITNVVPTDSTVNSLNGTEEDLQIALESENLVSLNDLLEQKINELTADKKRGIKKIEMHSFGLNPKTLKYNITFGITFN